MIIQNRTVTRIPTERRLAVTLSPELIEMLAKRQAEDKKVRSIPITRRPNRYV